MAQLQLLIGWLSKPRLGACDQFGQAGSATDRPLDDHRDAFGRQHVLFREPRLALDAVPREQRPDRPAAPLAEPRPIRRAGHDIDPIAPGRSRRESSVSACSEPGAREALPGTNRTSCRYSVTCSSRLRFSCGPSQFSAGRPASIAGQAAQAGAGERRRKQGRGRVVA